MKIGEPDHEDQAPPEQVGELAAGEHERGERERVARDDPLELGSSCASDARIDGSATFTTVLSSMIMNSPTDTAASVHHFLFSGVTKRSHPTHPP